MSGYIVTNGDSLPIQATIMLPDGTMTEVMWSEERERARRAYLDALAADVERTLEWFNRAPAVTHVRRIADAPQA